MYNFQKHNELNKTLSRFNKIRLYSNKGYRNLLPIKAFKSNPGKYQQIQLNTSYHFNAIIMDIDNEDLLTEWNHQGLPTPTIQTINKNNNKAHLVWLLNTPIWKSHKHVVSYYQAIVNSIKKLIGADVAYQNHSTKNFLNTELYRVTYNDVAYDLGDFRKFISHEQNEKGCDEFDYLVSGSRHIHLFELLRRYGYKIANERDLKYKLTKRAEAINEGFDEAIKVKYIVNSVYRFCEENKENFKNINRSRVMKFEKISNLSTEDFKKEVKIRQSKSAIRTTIIKKFKTATKIKIAIDSLLRQKKLITPQNISTQANISISTARRNIKIIKVFTQKVKGFSRSIRLIVQNAKQVFTTINNKEIPLNKNSNLIYLLPILPP